MTDPRNIQPKHDQQDGEDIEIFRFPIAGLLEAMEQMAERDGLLIDAKCYSLALGMSSKI